MLTKRTLSGLTACAALLTANHAAAITYADIHFGLPLAYLDASSNPSYGNTWNLAPSYNPATHQIDWAIATFVVSDLFLGGSETYSITLDGNAFASGGNVGIVNLVIGGISGNALVTLDATGQLDYLVVATSGNFWLKEAGLIAHGSYRDIPVLTQNIADGGTTIALLGLGFIGLFGVQRKLSSP